MKFFFLEGLKQLVLCLLCTGMLLGPHPFYNTHAKTHPVVGSDFVAPKASSKKKKPQDIPSDPALALKKFLKNNDLFDGYVPLHFKEQFSNFRNKLEHGWTHDGLAYLLRKHREAYLVLTPELHLKTLEHSYWALQIREAVENWVIEYDAMSPERLGTLQAYFEHVYYPMMQVQNEGRFYDSLNRLELKTALWPQPGLPPDLHMDLIDYRKSQAVRGPANEEGGLDELGGSLGFNETPGYVELTEPRPFTMTPTQEDFEKEQEQGFFAEGLEKITSFFTEEDDFQSGNQAIRSWKVIQAEQEDFAQTVSPMMNAKIKEFGEAVTGATENSKEINDLIKKYKELSPPRAGRRSSGKPVSEAVRKARAEAYAAYVKERDEILAKLNELEPRRGFWVAAGRKVKIGDETNREKNDLTIAQFYAEAARMTSMQLMLQEIYFYKDVLQDSSPFPLKEVAPSCLAQYEDFPDQVRYQLSSNEERMLHIEYFLSNNGLILSQYDQSRNEDFNQFFLGDSDRDMFDGNYSGMLPFLQLRTAQQGLRYTMKEEPAPSRSDLMQPYKTSDWSNLGEPAFDDIHHFLDVWAQMLEKAVPVLRGQHQEEFAEVTELIVSPQRDLLPDATPEETEAYYNAFIWGGYSKYLAKRLQEEELEPEQWLRVVPREVFNQWASNEIKIEFPPFYGPEGYKQWALRVLYKAILNGDLNDIQINGLCSNAPQIGMVVTKRGSKEFCKQFEQNGIKQSLLTMLEPFEESGPFVPAAQSFTDNLRLHWGTLRVLWDKILAKGRGYEVEGEFPAVTDEWSFLKTQVPHNPWAMVRISALLKLAEIKDLGGDKSAEDSEKKPQYTRKKRRATKPSPEEQALNNYKTTMTKALEALPVSDIKKPLVPMYASSVMKRGKIGWKFWKPEDEKIFFKSWEKLEHRLLKNNFHVLKLPHDKSSGANGPDLYSAFETVQRKPLLEEGDIQALVRGLNLDNQGVSTDEMFELIELTEGGIHHDRHAVLQAILDNPGDVEKHQQILDEYLEESGDTEGFMYPGDVAVTYLERNRDFQYPLMLHLVKVGAKKRIEALSKELEEYCSLDVQEDEDWKNLMSASAKAQETFNELFGLDAIPPEAEKYFARMDWRDKKDFKYIGFMIVGFIGLALAAAACGSGVGSIAGCPATAAIGSALMYSASFGALAYSTYGFLENSFMAWQERDERMRMGRNFEDLGYTDRESVNKRKGRSWMGFAFELATIGTMFVPIGLSLRMAGKYATHAAARWGAKRGGFASRIDVGETLKDVANVESALFRLGYRQRPKIAEAFEKRMKDLKYILAGANKPKYVGRIKRRLGHVASRANQMNIPETTIEEINERVGKKFADYFKNNTKAIARFVNWDVRHKHNRIAKVIEKYGATMDPKKQKKWLNRLNKYFNNEYAEPNIEMYKKLLQSERELAKDFAAQIAKKSPDEVAAFVAKNAEKLAPMMSDFTFHWWRIPSYATYMVFMQGAPWAFANNVLMRGLTKRAAVKTIFAAREHLAKQVIRADVLDDLGMEKMVAVVNSLQILRSGQAVVAEELASIAAKEGDEQAEIAAKKINYGWNRFRKEVATRVFEMNNPQLNPKQSLDEIRRIERTLFEASSDAEIEKAHRLLRTPEKKLFGKWDFGSKWRSKEEIFDFQAFGESSDILLERLAKEHAEDPKNLRKFGRYVSHLAGQLRMLASSTSKVHEVNPY